MVKTSFAPLSRKRKQASGSLHSPTPQVQLGIIWFLVYISFVLNWITVHQFVSERYTWIPSFGFCLIVASFAPAWLFWTIFGVAMMRIWAHLPTFYNEHDFYMSNVINFPKSEVAFGNLGVTNLRAGRPGSAADNWVQGININPDYDVNWYNMASFYRSQGQIGKAREFLHKAVNAKTCHFPEPWKKELHELDLDISWVDHIQKKVLPKDHLPWQHEQLTQAMLTEDLPDRDFWEKKFNMVQQALAQNIEEAEKSNAAPSSPESVAKTEVTQPSTSATSATTSTVLSAETVPTVSGDSKTA